VLSEDLSSVGITIPSFVIENISVPPEVEQALDRRTQMGILGDGPLLGPVHHHAGRERDGGRREQPRRRRRGRRAGDGHRPRAGRRAAMQRPARPRVRPRRPPARPRCPPPPPGSSASRAARRARTTTPGSPPRPSPAPSPTPPWCGAPGQAGWSPGGGGPRGGRGAAPRPRRHPSPAAARLSSRPCPWNPRVHRRCRRRWRSPAAAAVPASSTPRARRRCAAPTAVTSSPVPRSDRVITEGSFAPGRRCRPSPPRTWPRTSCSAAPAGRRPRARTCPTVPVLRGADRAEVSLSAQVAPRPSSRSTSTSAPRCRRSPPGRARAGSPQPAQEGHRRREPQGHLPAALDLRRAHRDRLRRCPRRVLLRHRDVHRDGRRAPGAAHPPGAPHPLVRAPPGTSPATSTTSWSPAPRHVSGERLEQLAPWALERAVPYQPEYLAGYRTLRYDVEPDGGLQRPRP
jgi:hypothetical protein